MPAGESHLDPGAVLRGVLELYRANVRPLLATACVVYAIDALAVLLTAGSGNATAQALGVVVSGVVATVYAGVVVKLVEDHHAGRHDHRVGELLAAIAPVFPTLLAVSLLAGLGIGAGILLFVVPGLVLATIWAVVAPVAVIEGTGVLATFARSREVVRGNGAPVFACVLVALLAGLVPAVVVSLATADAPAGAYAAAYFVVKVALAPLQALVAAVVFFVLR